MTAADRLLEQAQLRLKLQDFAGAVADYSQVLTQGPTPAAHYGRAMAQLGLGQGKLAAIDAQQALVLRPQWPAALRVLGKAKAQQRDWAGAIAAYTDAIEAYEQAEDPDRRAIDQCREQIRHWRKQPQNVLATDRPHRPPASVPLQDPALQNPAPKPPAPDPIAQSYQQSVQQKIENGDYQAALEDVTWVLQLDPQDLNALVQRGIILGRLGRIQDAFQDFERALAHNPHQHQIYAERARLRLRLGDAVGTVQDCDRWLEHVPGAVIALALRARAQGQLQTWAAAVADYDRAIALAPQQPDLQESKGDLYVAQHRAQHATSNAASNSTSNPTQHPARSTLDSTTTPTKATPESASLSHALAAYRAAAALWLNRGDRSNHDRLQDKIRALLTPSRSEGFEVPIQARAGSSPVLAVVMNDQVTVEMVLDTGCTTTLLTAEQARILGLGATGRQYTRVADGRVVEMGTGRLRSIAVGGATVKNLEVLIGDDRGAEEGLLGQNFFCHFEMRIRANTVEFVPLSQTTVP